MQFKVVFVVFVWGFWWRYHDTGIQAFGGRTSSDFLMDGVIGFVVTYSCLGWSWLSPGKRLVHTLLEQNWQTSKLQQSLLHLLFEGCTVDSKYLYLFVRFHIYLNSSKCLHLFKQTDVTWYDSYDWSSCISGVMRWWSVQCLSVARTILMPGATNSQVRGDCGAICGFCVDAHPGRLGWRWFDFHPVSWVKVISCFLFLTLRAVYCYHLSCIPWFYKFYCRYLVRGQPAELLAL